MAQQGSKRPDKGNRAERGAGRAARRQDRTGPYRPRGGKGRCGAESRNLPRPRTSHERQSSDGLSEQTHARKAQGPNWEVERWSCTPLGREGWNSQGREGGRKGSQEAGQDRPIQAQGWKGEVWGGKPKPTQAQDLL